MKNIARLSTSLFVAVVMALCALVMPAIAAQDEVRLYTTPATASLSAGTTATVQIRLSKTSGVRVDYVDAIITFPTSLLEATSISRTGSYFSVNNGPTVTYNNTAGTLRVTGNGTTLSTSADVLVASITLRVKTAGTAKLSFSQNSQAGDMVGANNIKNYLTASSGSTLTITNPVTPTPTTPPPTTPPETPLEPGVEPELEPEIMLDSEPEIDLELGFEPELEPEIILEPTEQTATDTPELELLSTTSDTDVTDEYSPTQDPQTQKRPLLLYALVGLGVLPLTLFMLVRLRRRQQTAVIRHKHKLSNTTITPSATSVETLLSTIHTPTPNPLSVAKPQETPATPAPTDPPKVEPPQPAIQVASVTPPAPTNEQELKPVITSLKRGGFSASSPKVEETPIHSDTKRIILQTPHEKPIIVPQAAAVVTPHLSPQPQPAAPDAHPAQASPQSPAPTAPALDPTDTPADIFEAGEQRLTQEGYTPK